MLTRRRFLTLAGSGLAVAATPVLAEPVRRFWQVGRTAPVGSRVRTYDQSKMTVSIGGREFHPVGDIDVSWGDSAGVLSGARDVPDFGLALDDRAVRLDSHIVPDPDFGPMVDGDPLEDINARVREHFQQAMRHGWIGGLPKVDVQQEADGTLTFRGEYLRFFAT